jgi:hypothetical protein
MNVSTTVTRTPGVGLSRDGIDTVLRVLHLPDPPDPVEHAVVEVEEGIARGAVEVLDE